MSRLVRYAEALASSPPQGSSPELVGNLAEAAFQLRLNGIIPTVEELAASAVLREAWTRAGWRLLCEQARAAELIRQGRAPEAWAPVDGGASTRDQWALEGVLLAAKSYAEGGWE